MLTLVDIPGVVAESIERRPRGREMCSSGPGRVKPMAYNIDTSHSLAWWLALIGQGKDWRAQFYGNVTLQYQAWCQGSDFPVGRHFKFDMSAHCHKLVPVLISAYLYVARTANSNNQSTLVAKKYSSRNTHDGGLFCSWLVTTPMLGYMRPTGH